MIISAGYGLLNVKIVCLNVPFVHLNKPFVHFEHTICTNAEEYIIPHRV